MVYLINGANLSYPYGDDFTLDITVDDYTENIKKVRLQIAKNGVDDILIDTTVDIIGEGAAFNLSNAAKAKLDIGNYVYRLSLLDEGGRTDTEKSGVLTVQWGV